jgi:FKBP-type peptidyl-prolyl cis-trans isomerase SlyD
MEIEKNRVVSLHYKLKEGSEEGNLVEETFGGDPLLFLFGVGQMLPEFESNLEGKKAGDEFAFSISSENAYGTYNEDAVLLLDKSTFEVDGKIDESLLKIGNVIPMSDPEGNQLHGTVKSVTDQGVQMDFNHPMAGVDLYFTGIIESVREATPTELQHGHANVNGGK